jgi:hypothetical protein
MKMPVLWYDVLVQKNRLKPLWRYIRMDFTAKACGCPEISTEEWDLAEREMGGTIYYSVRLPMFFHIPLMAARTEAKAISALREAALEQAESGEILVRDGLFSGRLLIAVKNTDVTGNAKLRTLAGAKVISKVVTGTRKDLSAGVSGLLSYVRTKAGTHPKAVYFWKVDCLRCGRENESTTVILAEL